MTQFARACDGNPIDRASQKLSYILFKRDDDNEVDELVRFERDRILELVIETILLRRKKKDSQVFNRYLEN